MSHFCKILIIFFILNGLAFAQTLPELEKVKQIKLLESTLDDVREILAEYKYKKVKDGFNTTLQVAFFITENAEIEVYFSKGKCDYKNNDASDWDVAEGLATSIKVIPNHTIMLKNLGLDLSKFKRENAYTNFKIPKVYHHKDSGTLIFTSEGKIESIFLEPSIRYYSMMCDKERAKQLLSTSSIFTSEEKRRYYHFGDANTPPDVINLILSLSEIKSNCFNSENKSCLEGVKIITVFSYAKDWENDTLTYKYDVSGGRILPYDQTSYPTSNRVLWDLSYAKPGTYTITASVDDGCGFCGKTVTKTVTVKECPDCKEP